MKLQSQNERDGKASRGKRSLSWEVGGLGYR